MRPVAALWCNLQELLGESIVRPSPFDKPGRFYRGNLHSHSTHSDGEKSAEEVCRAYRELGYDFLAITDHFMDRFDYPVTPTTSFWSDGFITLSGAELHAGEIEMGGFWHILAVGLPNDFLPNLPSESGPQIAQRALESGAFVAVAHPAWYGVRETDVLSLGKVHAIEVINGLCGDFNDRENSWYLFDQLTAQGHRYGAIATDDAHFDPLHQDVQRGWIWVKAHSLTPAALLNALKAGDYYSSTGPMFFDIDIERGRSLRLRCSPVNHIIVSGKGSESAAFHGNGLMEADLSLVDWKSDYCRITIRDRHGEKAWSNVIWFDDES